MNTTAFDAAIVEFSAQLRGFIRRRVRDEATADDLTQETLLKVYRSRAALRHDQQLAAWVYRVARRTLIDHYRRQRPRVELPAALAAESADEGVETREPVLVSMKRFLEELPEAYREPVRLAELEGLPLAKIALRSGLSLTAVKSRVRRGRQMLKKKLQQCCRFEFDRLGRVIDWERRQPGRGGCEGASQFLHRGVICRAGACAVPSRGAPDNRDGVPQAPALHVRPTRPE